MLRTFAMRAVFLMHFGGRNGYFVRFIKCGAADVGFALIAIDRMLGPPCSSFLDGFSFSGSYFRANGYFAGLAGAYNIFWLADDWLGTRIRRLFFRDFFLVLSFNDKWVASVVDFRLLRRRFLRIWQS